MMSEHKFHDGQAYESDGDNQCITCHKLRIDELEAENKRLREEVARLEKENKRLQLQVRMRSKFRKKVKVKK